MTAIFIRCMLRTLLACSTIGLMSSASADSLSVTFTEKAGNGVSPGVTALFTLNADGSIAASASSLGGALFNFGFNAPGQMHIPSYDFSILAQDASHSTAFGTFNSGWRDISNTTVFSPTTVTWTIGLPGSFSSVMQAFAGNDGGYEFFAYALDGDQPGLITQWGWRSSAPVPEPGVRALLLIGLITIGWVMKRELASTAS